MRAIVALWPHSLVMQHAIHASPCACADNSWPFPCSPLLPHQAVSIAISSTCVPALAPTCACMRATQLILAGGRHLPRAPLSCAPWPDHRHATPRTFLSSTFTTKHGARGHSIRPIPANCAALGTHLRVRRVNPPQPAVERNGRSDKAASGVSQRDAAEHAAAVLAAGRGRSVALELERLLRVVVSGRTRHPGVLAVLLVARAWVGGDSHACGGRDVMGVAPSGVTDAAVLRLAPSRPATRACRRARARRHACVCAAAGGSPACALEAPPVSRKASAEMAGPRGQSSDPDKFLGWQF